MWDYFSKEGQKRLTDEEARDLKMFRCAQLRWSDEKYRFGMGLGMNFAHRGTGVIVPIGTCTV
jgi:hypothetical protein